MSLEFILPFSKQNLMEFIEMNDHFLLVNLPLELRKLFRHFLKDMRHYRDKKLKYQLYKYP